MVPTYRWTAIPSFSIRTILTTIYEVISTFATKESISEISIFQFSLFANISRVHHSITSNLNARESITCFFDSISINDHINVFRQTTGHVSARHNPFDFRRRVIGKRSLLRWRRFVGNWRPERCGNRCMRLVSFEFYCFMFVRALSQFFFCFVPGS